MNEATWRKTGKTIKGRWSYNWAADCFWIRIDGRDPETGLERQPFDVHGEQPEFSGWKLMEKKVKPKQRKAKRSKAR